MAEREGFEPSLEFLGPQNGLANRRLQPLGNLTEPCSAPSVLLLLLLLSLDLAPPGTRLNTGDSFKSKTGVDNKRHTNAHQPLTSHSPIGVTIPPPPPLSLRSIGVEEDPNFIQVGDCAAPLSQSYPNSFIRGVKLTK
jgi:hypothetical protein